MPATAAPQKYRFFDKKLSVIQSNAKKLQEHPVLSNIPGISDQLNHLKSCHRRFIFALLSEKFGENPARELAQDEEVKALVDSFEDLDNRVMKQLTEKCKKIKKKDIVPKLKHSLFYKDKTAKEIREQFEEAMTDAVPDLLKPPKVKKAS